MYYSIAKIAGKVSLRIVLIIPFVWQLFGTVGLIVCISLRNGQKAVNKLADQLITQRSSDRIIDRFQSYLAASQLLNKVNPDRIKLRVLNSTNFEQLRRYFYQQWQIF